MVLFHAIVAMHNTRTVIAKLRNQPHPDAIHFEAGAAPGRWP
jgi:hypothetical protein